MAVVVVVVEVVVVEFVVEKELTLLVSVDVAVLVGVRVAVDVLVVVMCGQDQSWSDSMLPTTKFSEAKVPSHLLFTRRYPAASQSMVAGSFCHGVMIALSREANFRHEERDFRWKLSADPKTPQLTFSVASCSSVLHAVSKLSRAYACLWQSPSFAAK